MKILSLFLCFLMAIEVSAQEKSLYKIHGNVFDEDNSPLVGVTVQLLGTNTGTVTNEDGFFSLQIVNPENQMLRFSMIGMKSKEVLASKSAKVVLLEDSKMIDEIVVTGYGNFQKATFTGAASVLKTNNTLDVPNANLQQKLSGTVSGVSVTSSSAQPGSTPSVRIRGMGSMNAGNEPLYVIDGIPVQEGSVMMADYSESGTSMLGTLNDEDIESMTIIKDAAAASLYGSRAANGVIVITTKKGNTGKIKTNLTANWGVSNFAINYRPTLNADKRRELLYQGLENFGINNGMATEAAKKYADNEINTYAPLKENYTDWQKLLLQTGTRQQYLANVSGGSDQTRFYISTSYLDQEGILLNTGLKKYTGRINITHESDKFSIQGSSFIGHSEQRLRDEKDWKGNPIRAIYGPTTSPVYNPYDAKGGFSSDGAPQNYNPLSSAILNTNKTRMIRSINYLSVGYRIWDKFKVNQRLSYDFVSARERHWWDPSTEDGKGGNGALELATINMQTVTSQTQITYNKTFGLHLIDGLFAYETEQYYYDNHYSVGKGYPSPDLQELENASVTTASSHTDSSRLISYIGRLNYSYNNAYYLGLSFRRDGTSRLAPQKRWGNFWSISGSWRMSEATFWNTLKSILNDAQIRASWGENGTLPNNLYGYMGLYKYGYKYNGDSGAVETQQVNSNLKWERNLSTNIGFNLMFLNKFSLSLDYYNRNSKDLLYDMPVSQVTGFSTALRNIGALNNRGFEIEFKSRNMETKDLIWETSLNFFHNKNKLTKLDGRQDEIIEATVLLHKVGQAYNSFYGYEYAGVDSATGKEAYFVNKDGDRTTTTNPAEAQKISLGSADPKIQGGFTNYVRWKGFDCNLTLTFALGGKIYDNAAVQYLGSNGGTFNYIGQIPAYYDRNEMWNHPGDNALLPQFVYGNSTVYSSRWLMSSNHLRVKNMTIGYTISRQFLRPINIENIRVYASAENLYTFKQKSTYLDPEGPVNGLVLFQTPTARAVSFGINLSF